MKTRFPRKLVVIGLSLALAACGGGKDSSSTSSPTAASLSASTPAPVWTPGRYPGDTNLPDSPALPSEREVCTTLQASNTLVRHADGSLPQSADPTPPTHGGATTQLNNPDQARIQAALDACGAAVDADVGARIAHADQQAAARQQRDNDPLTNIGGATSGTLRTPAYKARKFAVRLVVNGSGPGNAFLSGPLVLPSGVTLWIDTGVTLYASRDVAVYDKKAQDRPNPITCGAAVNNPGGLGMSGMQNCYPLIRGAHTVHAAIMGGGSIDGRGYMPLISSQPNYPTIRWATGVTDSASKFSCWNTVAAYRAGTLAPEGTTCDGVTGMAPGAVLTSPTTPYVVNRQPTNGTTSRWVPASWWDISYHGNKDIGGGPYSFQANPGMVWMQHAKNLTLYQITLRNSPFFTVETDGVDGLTVWGIKIITPLLPDAANQAAVGMNNDAFDGVSGSYTHLYTGATIDASSTGVKNTDGIDPSVASGPDHAPLTTGSTTVSDSPIHFDGYVKNVAIVYNFLNPSDDNVAFKGGLADPRPAGARSGANMQWAIDGNRDVSPDRTWGIVVAHNHNYNGHGMSIGSPGNAGVRNIRFYDNYFDSSYDGSTSSTDMGVVGLRIKSGQARGGDVSNIVYDGACMRGIKDFLIFEMYYTAPAQDPISYTGLGYLIPSYHDIFISNVRMMNIPGNKAAGKAGAGNFTFRGLNPDANFANTRSVMSLNLDNVVVDNDVTVSIANLSKPVVGIPASVDGSTQSKAANAILNLGENVSLLGKTFVHGTGGILTNQSTGAASKLPPKTTTNTLNLTLNGTDDAGAAGDTDPAATIVAQNLKLSLCDQASSWPAFPNVK